MDYRLARRKIVGYDHNAPDPFPGFGGTVGLGQDVATPAERRLALPLVDTGWHLSMGSPFVVSDEQLATWRARGFPENTARAAVQGGGLWPCGRRLSDGRGLGRRPC